MSHLSRLVISPWPFPNKKFSPQWSWILSMCFVGFGNYIFFQTDEKQKSVYTFVLREECHTRPSLPNLWLFRKHFGRMMTTSLQVCEKVTWISANAKVSSEKCFTGWLIDLHNWILQQTITQWPRTQSGFMPDNDAWYNQKRFGWRSCNWNIIHHFINLFSRSWLELLCFGIEMKLEQGYNSSKTIGRVYKDRKIADEGNHEIHESSSQCSK